jgi:1,4-alpha-glucan branching enzyme
MVALNLAPKVLDYKIGIPAEPIGRFFNSDDEQYGGSGVLSEILKKNMKNGEGIRNR